MRGRIRAKRAEDFLHLQENPLLQRSGARGGCVRGRTEISEKKWLKAWLVNQKKFLQL